jgi:hypothetical protein
VAGIAPAGVTPGVDHLVQQRLFERLGIFAKMLGRELDQERIGIGNAAGRVGKARVVADATIGNLAVEMLVVQASEQELKIGFCWDHG